MVLYREGTRLTTLKKNKKRKESIKVKAILEIDFEDGLTLCVFPGTLSENDLLVKFEDKNIPGTQLRQPSHIHWAVDILIKQENKSNLINEFLKATLQRWNTIKSLSNRNFQTVINSLIISKDKEFINKFQQANPHGFFTMEFLTHLIEILMLQEKTNNPNAYMFKNVVNKLLEHRDLYDIISKARHSGN